MEKPEKYTLKAGYKFKVNGNKIVIHFYKYTGMYLYTVSHCGMIFWNYILDQKTCHQSINKLKKMFDVKPIKYSKNKKHNISLTPAGECFFNCSLCDSILYIRNQVWELDDRWYDCETQGIYLETDRQCEFSWRTPPYNIEKHNINMDNVIKSAEEFRVKIIKSINSFNCDICDDNHCYDNIYFCRQCEIVWNQRQISFIPEGITLNAMLEEAKKIQGKKYFDYSAYNNKYDNEDNNKDEDVIAPDVYNLCRDCYTESNIKAHADKCNNYCGFYLKPTTY